MNGGLAILAVDDEPRALADVKRPLETSASVDRVATATSAKEALVYLSGGSYDALFLDVQMPEIEGMAPGAPAAALRRPARGRLPHRPPDAAVEAFEVQALDFLVKPVRRERLGRGPAPRRGPRAAGRGPGAGRRRRRPTRRADGGPDVVAVDNPKGGGKRLVRLETIAVAQANGDYARILCDDGRFLLRTPLSQLEEDWGSSGFARVHRAFLVNLAHAVELRASSTGPRCSSCATVPRSRWRGATSRALRRPPARRVEGRGEAATTSRRRSRSERPRARARVDDRDAQRAAGTASTPSRTPSRRRRLP